MLCRVDLRGAWYTTNVFPYSYSFGALCGNYELPRAANIKAGIMKLFISIFIAVAVLGGVGFFLFNEQPRVVSLPSEGVSVAPLPDSPSGAPSSIPEPAGIPAGSSTPLAPAAAVSPLSPGGSSPATQSGAAAKKYTFAKTSNDEYGQFLGVMKGCLATGVGGAKGVCMDAYIKQFLQIFETKDALALIQRGMDADGTVLIQCHDMVHSIGRETLAKAGKVDAAFNECNQTCHSGCYHGVMERVFVPEGTDASHVSEADLRAKVPTICEGYDGKPVRYKFQCLHGIGHAIDFILENDLAKTLSVCDLLPSQYDISSCWGGALMENITSFDKESRWIKKGDPHYPCDVLDAKYQTDCYMMQTSIMFELGLTPQKIVDECRKAGPARLTCIQSLGRDISSSSRTNPNYGLSICVALPQDEKEACTRGIIYALSDLTWDGQYSFKFCDLFATDADKRFCYQYTVTYLQTGLGETKTAVRDYCEAQSKNRDICLQYIPAGD